MYHIRDKAEAIRTVQRYLGVTENGKFDDATSSALEAFQVDNGLNVSASVDYDTFNLLRTVYLESKIKAVAGMSELITDFPYSRGSFGGEVMTINRYLCAVLKGYTYELPLPRGAIYTEATGAAVERLREVFGMKSGDYVDEVFFARLKREIFALTEA